MTGKPKTYPPECLHCGKVKTNERHPLCGVCVENPRLCLFCGCEKGKHDAVGGSVGCEECNPAQDCSPYPYATANGEAIKIKQCPACGGALQDDSMCATPDCPGVTDRPVELTSDQQRKLDDMTGVDGGVILKHLHEQGVLSGMAERVIIDLQIGKPIQLYVQEFASVSLLNVFMGSPVITALMRGEKIDVEGAPE